MPELNDHVRVETTTGGCYHKKTGVVTDVLNGKMTSLSDLPAGSADAYPYWFRVRFDTPAENGGEPVESELFLAYELRVVRGS